MKQCLDAFHLNRRNTTILEENLYTISWFPSWTVSLFQRWFSKTRWSFHQFLSRGCWLHANSGSNLLWVEDIAIGFLRKIKHKQIINIGQNWFTLIHFSYMTYTNPIQMRPFTHRSQDLKFTNQTNILTSKQSPRNL